MTCRKPEGAPHACGLPHAHPNQKQCYLQIEGVSQARAALNTDAATCSSNSGQRLTFVGSHLRASDHIVPEGGKKMSWLWGRQVLQSLSHSQAGVFSAHPQLDVHRRSVGELKGEPDQLPSSQLCSFSSCWHVSRSVTGSERLCLPSFPQSTSISTTQYAKS